jgi:hypothetical protein
LRHRRLRQPLLVAGTGSYDRSTDSRGSSFISGSGKCNGADLLYVHSAKALDEREDLLGR